MCNSSRIYWPNTRCPWLWIIGARIAVRRYGDTLDLRCGTLCFALRLLRQPSAIEASIRFVSNQIMIFDASVRNNCQIVDEFAVRDFDIGIEEVRISICWNIICSATTTSNGWLCCWRCICIYHRALRIVRVVCILLCIVLRICCRCTVPFPATQQIILIGSINAIDAAIAFLFATNTTAIATAVDKMKVITRKSWKYILRNFTIGKHNVDNMKLHSIWLVRHCHRNSQRCHRKVHRYWCIHNCRTEIHRLYTIHAVRSRFFVDILPSFHHYRPHILFCGCIQHFPQRKPHNCESKQKHESVWLFTLDKILSKMAGTTSIAFYLANKQCHFQ